MNKYIYFIIVLLSLSNAASDKPLSTLSMRPFIDNPENYEYTRGRYLIIAGMDDFTDLISNEAIFGDFVKLKKSQGYDVDVELFSTISETKSVDELRDFIKDYSEQNPYLEYVLLVGDVNGMQKSEPIVFHLIMSLSKMQLIIHLLFFQMKKCIILNFLLEGGLFLMFLSF